MWWSFQVLNETSLWWFDKASHIAANAIMADPDKNVTIAQKCSIFPVEFVGKAGLFLVQSCFWLTKWNVEVTIRRTNMTL